MIALTEIAVEQERSGYCYGTSPGPFTRAREPVAEVSLKILASGADLDRLLTVLESLMPETRERARRQGYEARALPESTAPIVNVVDAELVEDP